jgi:hypothetical protein
MVYRPPALEINQNLESVQASEVAPLFATIVGPRYELHRYTEEDEKAQIGEYDPVPASTVYPWPDKIAGGIIELETAEVIVENALLIYNEQVQAVNVTVDNGNQVKSNSSFVWKTNAAANRDSSLGTRDVQVGDTALLTWNGGSDQLQTLVAGFTPEVVPGTTDPTNVRVTGDGDTSVGATEGVSPTPPTKYTRNYDASGYNGLFDGYPSDEYTIQVLQVGTGTDSGGTMDNTILYVTSLGNDVPQTVTFDATTWNGAGYDVPLGARGGTVEIVDAAGTVSVGDYWTVVISMDYIEVDVADPSEFDTIGPYTGDKDTQYVLTVTGGGTIGTDDITFNITTNNGADANVTITSLATDWAAVPAFVDYPFGNNGMTLRIYRLVSAAAAQYNTGDIVVFDVVGEQEGAIETLILRDLVSATTGDDLDITLMAEQTVEMDEVYRTLTQDNITIFANATSTVNLLGTTQAHKIFYGLMFADYRELDIAAVGNGLQFIDSISDIGDLVGSVDELNPLGCAVNYALLNSAGTGVYFIATAGDSYSAYESALDILTESRVVYSLVPLSNDEDIKELFEAHVLEQSTSANNQWRRAIVTNPTQSVQPQYVSQPNGNDLLVTISDIGPGLNDFRDFQVAGGTLVTQGVEPGDTLRTNYSTDAEGNVTFDEYIIDAIIDESNGRLLTGPPAAITVGIKGEFWRQLTNAEYAQALAQYPAKYDERRVTSLWADNPINSVGETIDLYYLCAAIAGQRSGVAPHQPLSRAAVAGADLSPVYNFSKNDADTVSSGGNWQIKKDPTTAVVATAHQLTSIIDPDDLIRREESITTNIDYISRDLYNNLDDLYGQGNVSDRMIQLIRTRIHVRNEYIRSLPYTDKIGPQITDVEIISIEVHPTLKDTIIVEIDYTVPSPLNVLRVNMNIGVG